MHTKKASEILNESSLRDGESVKLMCIVQEKKIHVTKNGDKMWFLTVTDGTGEIDVLVFPDIYAVSGANMNEDSILLISGKISLKDESVSVICGLAVSEIELPRFAGHMKLCIKCDSKNARITDELSELCRENPGETQICFYLTDLKKTIMPKNRISLSINETSFKGLKKLYGTPNIGLIQ